MADMLPRQKRVRDALLRGMSAIDAQERKLLYAAALETLLAMLRFDPKEMFDAEGKIRPPEEWPEGARDCIDKYAVHMGSRGGVQSIVLTFPSKLEVAKTLAQLTAPKDDSGMTDGVIIEAIDQEVTDV